MAADGLDTGFGDVGEAAWRGFVRRSARVAGIVPGSSVFEVGCGAGAYLFELAEMGCEVGGLDASPALDVTERRDFVGACGVFLYFPSVDYAGEVLARMVRKARRGVMVLEVPDLAKREQTEARRRAVKGEAAYATKYDGLSHLYMDKAWFERTLGALGCGRVHIEDQAIEGYENAAGRYNVFAWRDSSLDIFASSSAQRA